MERIPTSIFVSDLAAALAREAEPEASLTELAAMMDPPITKPAMNNRMKKLLKLAEEGSV